MKKTTTTLLFVLAVACAGIASRALGGEPTPPEKESAMKTAAKDDLLRKIETLRNLKTLSRKAVAKTLGVSLKCRDASENQDGSDCASDGPEGSSIASIEIRGVPGVFLILEISPSFEISIDDVKRRFGKETSIRLPAPPIKSYSRDYFVYASATQSLKFGMKPGNNGLLMTVVLDRTDAR